MKAKTEFYENVERFCKEDSLEAEHVCICLWQARKRAIIESDISNRPLIAEINHCLKIRFKSLS